MNRRSRGTFCDLAVKLDDAVRYLIEVKAVGLDLRDNHLRQAVNYGANQGIPWVVLTNGINWEIYRIKFEKPIAHEKVCAFNFLELSARKSEDQELLYLLCKEGLSKAAIEAFHERVQVINRFVIAALIQSDPVLSVMRRELKRWAPSVRPTVDELRATLPDVLKRDVIEAESTKPGTTTVEPRRIEDIASDEVAEDSKAHRRRAMTIHEPFWIPVEAQKK